MAQIILSMNSMPTGTNFIKTRFTHMAMLTVSDFLMFPMLRTHPSFITKERLTLVRRLGLTISILAVFRDIFCYRRCSKTLDTGGLYCHFLFRIPHPHLSIYAIFARHFFFIPCIFIIFHCITSPLFFICLNQMCGNLMIE